MIRFSIPAPAPRRASAVAFILAVLLAFGAGTSPARAGDATDTAPAAENSAAPAAEKAAVPAALSKAPDFTGTGIDGKTYRLKDLLAKGPVLIDFWTTWCKPCMQELPHLQKIWEKYHAQGFTLLGVASDDPRTAAKIKPLVQSKGFKFTIVTDGDRKIGNLYNVRNYPTAVLVAPDGSVVSYAQGYHPGDETEMETRIVALLGGAEKTEKAEEPSKTGAAEPHNTEGGTH